MSLLINPYAFGGSGGGGGTTYDDEVLADSPVAYWKLDGTSGDVVDEIGNHPGTNIGAARGADPIVTGSSASFDFDGVDDEVVVPYHADLNPSTFSIEFWIVMESGASREGRPISAHDPNNGEGWDFSIHSFGHDMKFYVRDGSGNVSEVSGPELSTETVYHFVGTYDGTTQRLYQNGTEVGSTSTTFTPNADDDLKIGNRAVNNSFYDEGRVDCVAVYDTALSAARVTAHYDAGTA